MSLISIVEVSSRKEDWSKENLSKQDWSKQDWRPDKPDSNARQVPTIIGAMPSQRHRSLADQASALGTLSPSAQIASNTLGVL